MNIKIRKTTRIEHTISRLSAALSEVFADRVIAGFLIALSILLVVDPERVPHGFSFAVHALTEILPFLLIAVSLAALSRATGADRLIARAFTGHPGRAVFVAAAAGALSPFCSCGVVPVIAALLRSRVPLAPVMAFWITSPVMDPEMFVLTAAGISTEFAVAKTIATILMGLLAGFGVYLVQDTPGFISPLREDGGRGTCSSVLPESRIDWRFWESRERRRTFFTELSSTSLFLGKWLFLAFFLESLMMAYIPSEWVAGLFGSGSWYEIPLASVVGIPAYLNGYAAIPLISGLMAMGMNPGAAMAFMTAGAVSSIPAAMAVAVLVKRPVFVAYLALGLAGSMLTGAMYAAFL